MDYRYWLTPAPTETITIRFEWADQGLSQTTFRIDAAELQRAVGQAVERFSPRRLITMDADRRERRKAEIKRRLAGG